MRAAKGTLASIGVTALAVVLAAIAVLAVVAGPAAADAPTSAAAGAAAEGPTREEYAAQVEPVCERNTLANERILKGVREKVNSGRMKEAGRQFVRASARFGATVKEIAAVPRPPADDARLVKWFGFLKVVAKNLRKVGRALIEGNRVKAVHERIRVERSSNAANNVSFVFGFRHCRIVPSRFL